MTKKAGYTPAPWKVSHYDHGDHYSMTLVVAGDLPHQQPIADVDGANQDEAEANAKLIAQCPRMVRDLERLTLLVRNMKDVYGVKAAEWLIGQQAFKEAEQTLNELRDAGVIE